MSASDDSFQAAAVDLRLATFRLARRLRRERAVDSMSDAQFAVLATLRAHGRATLGSLAEREHVSAPSMNRTVNCLEEAGYVVRVPDEDDRRRVQIDITPTGNDIVSATIIRRDTALASALAGLDFSEDDLEILRRASALMRKVAER
ncbi:MarR family winged helix-turn-helix transcriptional regulator [Microbacterium sp. NPDC057659]|uniref:MarR family winged helix-turn-helix transcriptional regulator n=1 Tax=Microbacterium sp. NPDC057659 TaxID=3346198 RepID=UPI00366E79A1